MLINIYSWGAIMCPRWMSEIDPRLMLHIDPRLMLYIDPRSMLHINPRLILYLFPMPFCQHCVRGNKTNGGIPPVWFVKELQFIMIIVFWFGWFSFRWLKYCQLFYAPRNEYNILCHKVTIHAIYCLESIELHPICKLYVTICVLIRHLSLYCFVLIWN